MSVEGVATPDSIATEHAQAHFDMTRLHVLIICT